MKEGKPASAVPGRCLNITQPHVPKPENANHSVSLRCIKGTLLLLVRACIKGGSKWSTSNISWNGQNIRCIFNGFDVFHQTESSPSTFSYRHKMCDIRVQSSLLYGWAGAGTYGPALHPSTQVVCPCDDLVVDEYILPQQTKVLNCN